MMQPSTLPFPLLTVLQSALPHTVNCYTFSAPVKQYAWTQTDADRDRDRDRDNDMRVIQLLTKSMPFLR